MKAYIADLLMLLVTIFWGASYLFMDMGLHSLSEFNLIALRFGFAFIIVLPILFRRLRRIDLNILKYSFILGFILFLVFTLITFGLNTTTTSNAGFLISLTVVFVPLINTFILKRKLESKIIISIVLSMIGIGFLTIQFPFHIKLGDLFCVMAALLYAAHIIIVSFAVKEVNPLNLGMLQLGFTGLIGLVFSLIFETPALPSTAKGWTAILALSILCSALGFILQIVAQKYTSATRTGLIFSLEPVFAALFGYLFINEVMSSGQFFGAFLVLFSIIFMSAGKNIRVFKLKRMQYKE
ncbi:DMT family transporter [Oceanobacillus sp. FSL K6-2867]|uniref:DMT family transporter n=1 Tax=Oceanobacillus sp. FSL K6-2867 TaxID=2954748 RepID=UPI0030D7F8B5